MINNLEIVIRNHEKKFNKNNYDGELFRSSPYRFIKGEGNIIISASHSVNHYRQGTTKVADMLTGAFALYLHEVTSCHVFLRTYNDQKDPNFDDVESDGGYKRALEGIIKEYDIDCLVDLHASAESRPFDIDIGTDYSRTLNGFDIIPEIVKKISEKNEIDVVTHNKVFAAPPNTVTNYISQANQIPCIQLEINRRFRDFDRLDNMSKMLSTLSEFTSILKEFNFDSKDQLLLQVRKSEFHIPQDKINFNVDDMIENEITYNDTFFVRSLSKFSTIKTVRNRNFRESNNVPKGVVEITNRMYFEVFGDFDNKSDSSYVIIEKSESIDVELGVSKAEHLDIYFGKELYEKLDNQSNYYLYNKFFDIDYPISKYRINDKTTKPDRIFLDRYHKELFNVVLPLKTMSKKIYILLTENLLNDEGEKEYFDSAYEEKNGFYEIKKHFITDVKLRTMQKKMGISNLELIKMKEVYIDNNDSLSIRRFLLGKLIGSKKMKFRVTRGYKTDEYTNSVRLSAYSMIALGVTESDKVIISNGINKVSLRVLPIDNFESLKLSNEMLYEEFDTSLIIGIPNVWRIKLGLYSLNSIVTVERDTSHIFIRNAKNQIIPFVGIVFTIFQTFEDYLMRLALIIIFAPIAIFINYSEERNQIDEEQL